VLVDWSTSQVDSVEHIFWPSSSTGLYALAVDGGRLTTAEPYGIAFNLVAPTNSPLADADVDGVPDAFETAHFGEIYFYEADGDPDGDGAGNYNEYMADTLPTNSNSVFSIEALQVTNETLVLTFGSSTGRQYKIDYSDNFLSTNSSAWMEATTNWFPGNGSATNWVDDGSETDPPPSETTGRVYRAKVSLR
jgi:hypothetical protein